MKVLIYPVILVGLSFSGVVRADLFCYENTPVYNFTEDGVSNYPNIQANIVMRTVKTDTVLRSYSSDDHVVLEYYKNKKFIQNTLKKVKNGIYRNDANLIVIVNQATMYHYQRIKFQGQPVMVRNQYKCTPA
ncbi:hypothetical protein [Enterobacter roggenkampii]|uniref:hypothetical protein n=2 Tax=Enterobacter roggenkampii TaxID=1812935 RepID=UPI0012B9F5CD|nr:hypothetical protein [Enterobacter roggenkampii]QLS76808.1 hypothetical protein HV308_19065 [Enterobacter roggenkampii]HCT7899626.1 hypothetical protein [Enterobacter cloacae]